MSATSNLTDSPRGSALLFPIEDFPPTPSQSQSDPREIPRPTGPVSPDPMSGSPILRGRITGEPRLRGSIPISHTSTGVIGKNESPDPGPIIRDQRLHGLIPVSNTVAGVSNKSESPNSTRLPHSPGGDLGIYKARSEDKEKNRGNPPSPAKLGRRGSTDTGFSPSRNAANQGSPHIQRGFTPLIIDNRESKADKEKETEREISSSPPRGINPTSLAARKTPNDKGKEGSSPSLDRKNSSSNVKGGPGSPKNTSPLHRIGAVVNTITSSLDPFKRGSININLPDEDENFLELQNLGSIQPCDISQDALAIISDIDKSEKNNKGAEGIDEEFYNILEQSFGYVPLEQKRKLEIIKRWLSQQAFHNKQNIQTAIEFLKAGHIAVHIQFRLERIAKALIGAYASDHSKKTLPFIDAWICSEEFRKDPFSLIEHLCKTKNHLLTRIVAKMVGGASLLGRFYLIYKYAQASEEISRINKKVLGCVKQPVQEIENITYYQVVRQLIPDGYPIVNFSIGGVTFNFKNPNLDEDVNRFEYFRQFFTQLNRFLQVEGDVSVLAFRLSHEYKYERKQTLNVEEEIEGREGSKIKRRNVVYIHKLIGMLRNDMFTKLDLLKKIIKSRLIPDENEEVLVLQSICKDILCNWENLRNCILRLKSNNENDKDFFERLNNFEQYSLGSITLSTVGKTIDELDKLRVPKGLYSREKYKDSFISRFEPRLFSYPPILKTANMSLLYGIRKDFISTIWPDLLPKLIEDNFPKFSQRTAGELVLEMNKSRNGTHQIEILRINHQNVTIQKTSAAITYYQSPSEKVIVGNIYFRYETVFKEKNSRRKVPYYKSKPFIDRIELNEQFMMTAEGHSIREQLIEKLVRPISSPRSQGGSPHRV